MTDTILPLSQLPNGAAGTIKYLTAQGQVRRHLLDLGLVAGSRIESIRRSPAGDPTAFNIRGAIIALRNEDADQIFITIDKTMEGKNECHR
ncbi:MAG: FeoA family protein [Thermacetogeniaceae bacterium]|jgi:ferrous iron transport protein A|nr:ferrous iron transport protein A [Syntrophomonadaceae bacterium]